MPSENSGPNFLEEACVGKSTRADIVLFIIQKYIAEKMFRLANIREWHIIGLLTVHIFFICLDMNFGFSFRKHDTITIHTFLSCHVFIKVAALWQLWMRYIWITHTLVMWGKPVSQCVTKYASPKTTCSPSSSASGDHRRDSDIHSKIKKGFLDSVQILKAWFHVKIA